MSVFQHGNTWLSAARHRAKQGLMHAMGGQSSSEDQEYDDKYRHFNSHVQELSKMKELMEIWMDSFDSFCKATTLLSDSWKHFHSTNPYYSPRSTDVEDAVDQEIASKFPFHNAAKHLDNIALCIDEKLRPAIVSTFQTRCIKPLSSILSMVPGLQENHQLRKSLLSEFDSYRLKMEKEFAVGRDSSHPNVMRKAAKLDESAKRLHSVQSNLFQKFYEFETARSQTLGPELGVFISCLYTFSSSLHAELSEVVPLVPQAASSLAVLDAMRLNPPNTSNRIAKPHNPVRVSSNNIVPHLAAVIVARPVSAGGAVGGYGTVTVQDYHTAASQQPWSSLMTATTVNDNNINSNTSTNYPYKASSITDESSADKESRDSSQYSSVVVDSSFLSSNGRPISEMSERHSLTYHHPPQDSDEDYNVSSRPVSDLTMDTMISGSAAFHQHFDNHSHLSGLPQASADVTCPPPKPPRKVRPASSASHAVDHMEAVKEADEETSSVHSGKSGDVVTPTPPLETSSTSSH